ncbi:hypothetical protein ABPG75_012914 [Micractinium tetrahymenae]
MDPQGRPLPPEKPVGMSIPLTAVSWGLEEASPASAGPAPTTRRTSSWLSPRSSSCSSADMDLETARKKLGLSPRAPCSRRKGLFGWLKRK